MTAGREPRKRNGPPVVGSTHFGVAAWGQQAPATIEASSAHPTSKQMVTSQ